MNRKSFFISLILFFITVFFAYSQTITIDNAVSNCVQYLQNRYPNSTRAALIFIQSENAELGEFVLNKVSAALVNSNWFRVVERNSAVLEQIDQELYLNRSLIVSRDTALSLGRQLGAQIIISGSFTRNGQNWLLDIQAVNAETAERTGHFTAENIRYDSALSQALTGAAIQAGPSIPANMVRIEGGTFQMGSASGGDSDERPVRQVTVDSFYMSIYEVTQKEWFDVMGTTIRQQRDMEDRTLFLRGEGDNYPMYYVSWYEAIEYCNKRSLKEGLTPVYGSSGNNITCNWNANGYRLPTEAEWEYAAKGGGRDPLIYTYSGSNNAGAVAWYADNSGDSTHPVGTKAPNSLGLYDMSGNVGEWCWDWYGTYPSGAQTNPYGAASGIGRVERGGGINNSATGIRSAVRGCLFPDTRHYSIGFRVVRSQ